MPQLLLLILVLITLVSIGTSNPSVTKDEAKSTALIDPCMQDKSLTKEKVSCLDLSGCLEKPDLTNNLSR